MQRRHFIIVLGGASSWPFAVAAQQTPARVIGFLGAGALAASTQLLAAFKQGLSDGGYVEGQNVAIEYRWANGNFDRLPALAADLVGRKVDVIVAQSALSARAAKSATLTILRRITIDWDTSQADDFRTRGVSWTIK
jgi:putative ABC transport system substrate-binding protein